MHTLRSQHLLAILFSVALHALALLLVGGWQPVRTDKPEPTAPDDSVMYLQAVPAPPEPAALSDPQPATALALDRAPEPVAPAPAPAFMEAPPAPTAEEWALAATYTLKNSKRYRYTWGQQVRSMMGTAFEGPDQGVVRFRIEIAPDGTLVRLETLWTTSAVAEQLARQAIENMPRLPPTPTGQPLVFEKTISFQPFDAEGPPIYKNDCLPDPPVFGNPYVWDGRSPQGPAVQPTQQTPEPEALEECLRQLPQDSVEAEGAHDRRQLEQWRSDRLGR